MHRICHQKIHATFSEKELAAWFHTFARLRHHDDMRKFIAWVRKKHPEYYDASRFSQERRRR